MRDAITVAAEVTRTSLGLGPLSLSQDGVIEVVSLTPGDVAWRRTVAEGKYQRGRVLLQAQQSTVTDVLVLRLYGASMTAVENRTRDVREAFSQFVYTLTTTVDGVTRTVTCEPADLSIIGDDTRQKTLTYHRMREVSLSIPRDPELTAGAI